MREVDAADLVPGDVILLQAGDQIPADARLIEAHDFRVDNSALTGESRPAYKLDEPVENGPLYRLFEHPYPGISWSETVEALVSNLELHGRGYLVFGEYFKAIPVSMWCANSELMKAKRGEDDKLLAYEYGYGVKKKIIRAEDVMEFKYWKALAPITAARLDVLQQFHANQYNANFFKQGGLMKGFFKNTSPRQLTPAQEQELERAIQQRGGTGNKSAHKIPVFSGVEYVPVGISQKDMEFLGLQNHSLDYILMVLGVPKAILGFTDGFNYANMKEIRKDFWNKSLIPIMRLLEWGFWAQFFERFKLPFYGAFNTKGIQELQEDLGQQAVTAKIFYDMGIPFPIINERLGLDFPEFEPENRNPFQFPMMPEEEPKAPAAPLDVKAIAKALRQEEEERLLLARTKREERIPLDIELRRSEWRSTEKRMKSREERMLPKVRGFFAERKAEVLQYLKDNGVTEAKDVGDAEWLKRFADFLRAQYWGEALLKAVESEEFEAFMAGAKRTYWGVGMRFGLPPERALAFVHTRGVKLANATEEVVTAIVEGMEQGMPSAKIAEHINDVFDNCSKVRSKLIARTETTVAYNGGRVDGMRVLGIKKKQWVNSGDSNVRDSHRDENIQELIVEIDQPFTLGSGARVMYPGDGPASEACNCRCTVTSVIGDSDETA